MAVKTQENGSEKLKEIQEFLQISQQDFADMLGVGLRTLKRYLAGGRQPILSVVRLAETLEKQYQAVPSMDPDELADRIDSADMTDKELAEAVGVTPHAIRLYKSGLYQISKPLAAKIRTLTISR